MSEENCNGFVVLGSGISGLSAAYHLKQNGKNPVIYEKDNDWGGLCSNFTIDGFRFDRFVHFTFTKDEYIHTLFNSSSELAKLPAISNNYYKGVWLKHPAQDNLEPLSFVEKLKIIYDFINRPKKEIEDIKDYSEWLECQYGKYFAHNFPFRYTRKYWGVEPQELETKWVGIRMHSPSLMQVLKGALKKEIKENFYYTKYMQYPKFGGFRSILNNIRKDLNIEFQKKVVEINKDLKLINFSDGSSKNYNYLLSSIPLPDIVNMINDVPEDIKTAAKNLKYTCGYQLSLGFNRPDVAKDLWFYIYDEEIPPARVYSPNLKSADNVPQNCSSMQAEIFFANNSKIPDKDEILYKTLNAFIKMGLFKEEDIAVKDIRFEKFANVIFDKEIYKNRENVINYLDSIGIIPIGRFGKWDYLWSDQAFDDGRCEALNLLTKLT